MATPKLVVKRRYAPAYPALMLQQNAHRFYFTTIPVDDLFPVCFVSRRDEDSAAGFQRSLNEERADDIASYLAAGTGSIPTNVVLSAQPNATLRYTRANKTISFNRIEGAFLILDGQHRLWGYQKCAVRHRVPVAIYENLSRAEEARLFIDINTNQRGVPATLLLDIKKIAEVESRTEAELRDIFDELATDAHSPLCGKLSASKSLAGRVSRVAFNRSVGPTLAGSVLSDMDPQEKYKLVRNYLNAFDAELVDKALLVRAAFFEAMFELLDEIVRATVARDGNAKRESLRLTIKPLAKIDWEQPGVRLTKTTIVQLMRATLRRNLKISKEML